MGLSIHVDGGSRGNPGPAGAGVVICDDDGRLLHESAWFLGRQTNNAAEYLALLRALTRAADLGSHTLTIHSDSELLVRQLTGQYQVKSPKLAQLFEQAQRQLLKVSRWSMRHIPRDQNRRADELANLAMDRGADVLVFDVDGQADGSAPAAAAPGPSPAPAETPARGPVDRPDTARLVRVTLSRPPADGTCPAGRACSALASGGDALTVGATLPGGLCLHAAHALLPTLLAIRGTAAAELAAVPTMTVRCSRPECGAEFQLAPVRSSNGHDAGEAAP